MGKQPSGALANLLLNPAGILELIEDLPDVMPMLKGKNVLRWEHMKPSVYKEDH
jgi:hypothetical protein